MRNGTGDVVYKFEMTFEPVIFFKMYGFIREALLSNSMGKFTESSPENLLNPIMIRKDIHNHP